MAKNQQKSLKIFEQRRNTLKKKAKTLSSLCNDVCLLCFGPAGDFTSWPEDQSEVRSIIERYREASERTANNKRFRKEKLSLSDVLDSKIKALQKQLSDQALDEASNSDPASLWDQQLDFMPKESLAALSGCLESKIQAIDRRIGSLNAQKNSHQPNGFFPAPTEGFLGEPSSFSLPLGYQGSGQQDTWLQNILFEDQNPNANHCTFDQTSGNFGEFGASYGNGLYFIDNTTLCDPVSFVMP